jgi:hypothetical protein
MTAEEIEAIVGGYHGDAFRILGPHAVREGRRVTSWIGRSRSEKLDAYVKVLYDLLLIGEGAGEIVNQDIRGELEAIAAKVHFAWIRKAVFRLDEIAEFIRRNIQKSIALDSLIVELRAAVGKA